MGGGGGGAPGVPPGYSTLSNSPVQIELMTYLATPAERFLGGNIRTHLDLNRNP